MFKDLLIWLTMPLYRSEMLELQRYRNIVHDLHRYCASDVVADKVTSMIIAHAARNLPYSARDCRDSLESLGKTDLPALVGSVTFPAGTPKPEVLREAFHQYHVYNGHFKVKVETDNPSHLRQKAEQTVKAADLKAAALNPTQRDAEPEWRNTSWQDTTQEGCSSDSSSDSSSCSSSSSSD